MAKEETNESPFKAGDCLCGIPNCAGHEEVDGKISFKGHPLGDLEADAPTHSS